MQIGIVGLPNVGKSTLFNSLTKSNALVANYPFTTIEPNVGIVAVPDDRLLKIASIVKSNKVTHTSIKFVDIAGLVKGASKGEGLGNKFLSHIREVDAVVHLIRCFDDENVSHVFNSIDPVRDFETIRLELALADIDNLQNKLHSVGKMCKTGEKHFEEEKAFINFILSKINTDFSVKFDNLNEEQNNWLNSYQLLSVKPVLYALNVNESQLSKGLDDILGTSDFLKIVGNDKVVVLCVKLESDILEFSDEERSSLLKEMQINESGLIRLIKQSYKLLSLLTFYTFNENELRAWTIESGGKAAQAAGKVHSDMEKGFIKAEVIASEDLIKGGSIPVLREKGLVKTEGREYIVKDGDILYFKFSN